MKIPRSIVLREPLLSPSAEPATWISVAEASTLLKVRPSTIINRIQNDTLQGRRSDDLPYSYDGRENYLVLLEALPQKAQLAYQIQKYKEDGTYVSVDLASPRSTFGDVWISQFINIAQLLRDAAEIRQRFYGTGKVTGELTRLAHSYGISKSTLYRFESQPQAKDVSLLYTDPVYLQKKLPNTMCLWSCDLAFVLFLCDDKHYSQNSIQAELDALRGKIPCTDCPYHPDAKREGFDVDIPVCGKCAGAFMIVPNNRRALNRLLEHIPPQLILFCRKGYRDWRARYGLFSMREKPLLVGECFQGDHHVFNIFVMVKIHTYRNDKKYEKVIAVRPVLTAWMDTATGYIVGWVISILPNSDTIAEAFCRACVPTAGDIAAGLPKSILVDCGRDFKSKLLEDPCSTYSVENWDEPYLNRRFSGMGVLNSLGCRIIHSIPYHPQSKDIERFFGTLENKFICHLKGWCYNNVQDRPADFGKKHQAMLGKREFFWFDEFVNLFATEILPAYHGTPDDPREHPDLDGWLLSFESMSPAQRYTALEKARTVIPDWKTMSILKQHYYPEKPLVRSNGIRFQNTYYKDDALAGIVGDHVSILCHAFTPPYAPASITVIHNGKAICEAYPVIRNRFTDESPSVLSEASDTQNRPVREMKKAVSRINRSANAILPENCKEPVPTRKDQLREYTSGQTPLEETGDQDLSAINKAMASITDGSSHASRAAYDKAYTMLFGAYDE